MFNMVSSDTLKPKQNPEFTSKRGSQGQPVSPANKVTPEVAFIAGDPVRDSDGGFIPHQVLRKTIADRGNRFLLKHVNLDIEQLGEAP